MIQNKSILITGHTGLIGSALWDRLQPSNNMEGDNGTSKAFSGLPPYAAAPDYIIHAAGYAAPSQFMANPMGTIHVNTARLMRLIDDMKPSARLLFMSSSEVYSGSSERPHDEYDIGTTTPEHPRAAYIESKRCGEAICHAARAAGKDVVIARVSSVYGHGFKRDDTRVLPSFIRQAVDDCHVSVGGWGHDQRAWLYVDDCADMLLTILERGSQAVYNVGGAEACSIAALAESVADLAGCSYSLGMGEAPLGAPSCVKLDMTRYKDEFGAPALTPLGAGLAKTIDWYRQTYSCP